VLQNLVDDNDKGKKHKSDKEGLREGKHILGDVTATQGSCNNAANRPDCREVVSFYLVINDVIYDAREPCREVFAYSFVINDIFNRIRQLNSYYGTFGQLNMLLK
jgi:hypothetical protein